jgi:hypothetical protein
MVMEVTLEGAEDDTHVKLGEDVIDGDTTSADVEGDNKQESVEVWFECVPGTLVVGRDPLFVAIAEFRLNT